MEYTDIELEIVGRRFDFRLCRRDLTLGSAKDAIRLPYYWMALPELRKPGGGTNVRPCIDLWWAMTEAQSFTGRDRVDAEVQIVLAELYPHIVGDRSPQRVFLDALLKPEPFYGERDYALPDAEWRRLLRICRRQDLPAIDREARNLLIDDQPSAEEMSAFQEACRSWVGNGIVALRVGGVEGLRRFAEFDMLARIRRYRRRGKLDRERLFIDMMSAEAAAAFRVCYASAWAEIVPALVTRNLLDPIGERFHGFWHSVVRESNTRDSLVGLVPALHPLSERVFRSGVYRETLRAWLQAANLRDPDNGSCAEFWHVFAVILAAAAEHKHLRDAQNTQRRKPEAQPDPLDDDPIANEDVISELFATYAANRALVCPACGGPPQFVGVNSDDDVESGVRVTYGCTRCQHRDEVEIE